MKRVRDWLSAPTNDSCNLSLREILLGLVIVALIWLLLHGATFPLKQSDHHPDDTGEYR